MQFNPQFSFYFKKAIISSWSDISRLVCTKHSYVVPCGCIVTRATAHADLSQMIFASVFFYLEQARRWGISNSLINSWDPVGTTSTSADLLFRPDSGGLSCSQLCSSLCPMGFLLSVICFCILMLASVCSVLELLASYVLFFVFLSLSGGVGIVGYSRSGRLWQIEASLLPWHRRNPHVFLHRQSRQFR